MTKVAYKCFDANGELVEIVNTLDEAKVTSKKLDGHYEIFYNYRETYSEGHAWAFKRMSGNRT